MEMKDQNCIPVCVWSSRICLRKSRIYIYILMMVLDQIKNNKKAETKLRAFVSRFGLCYYLSGISSPSVKE